MFLFFFCVFIQSLFASRQLFELDELNPSYAIHGKVLKEKQNITVIGCRNCTFLVDIAFRECHQENPVEYETKPAQVCYDPIPLVINNGIPSNSKCTDLLKIHDSLLQFVYACHYAMPFEELFIQYRVIESGNDFFGLSIRVKEWVQDLKLLLIPQGEVDSNLAVFDFANEYSIDLDAERMITFVGWGMPFEGYPRSIPDLLYGVRVDEQDCDPADAPHYLIHAGSFPGKILNLVNLIDNVSSILSYPDDLTIDTSRSLLSALSIQMINKNLCPVTAKVIYLFNIVHDESIYPEQHAVLLTSPYYPWVFDEQDHDDWDYSFYMFGQATEHDHTFVLDRLEGGVLSLALYGFIDEPLKIYRFGPEAQGKSIPVLHDETIGAYVSFMPTFDPGPKGFVFRMVPDDLVYGTSCDAMIKLSSLRPSAAIDPMSLPFGHSNICVMAEECSRCVVLIDVCSDQQRNLTDFVFNGQRLHDEDCELHSLVPPHAYYACCRFRGKVTSMAPIPLVFMGSDPVLAKFSFRLAEFVNEEARIFILDIKYNRLKDLRKLFSVPIDERVESFIHIMSPGHELLTGRFEIAEFESVHPIRNDCSYELYANGIPGNESATEQLLMVFDDSKPFYPIQLISPLYTIHVPKACTPRVLLISQASIDDQDQCDGVALAEGGFYRSPLYSIAPGPHQYSMNWTCETTVINVTIEVIAVVTGNLSITIIYAENETISSTTLDYTAGTYALETFTEINVHQVWVDWQDPNDISPEIPSGFFVRLYFQPEIPEFTDKSSTRNWLRTTSILSADSNTSNQMISTLIVLHFMFL